jgi:hypothetical protein
VSLLGRLARFLYDFVVGDDWRLAAGVGVALGVLALLVATGIPAWWFLPLAVALLVVESVARGARSSG